MTIGHTVWCRLITKFWISQFRIQSRSGPQDGRLGIRLVDNARQGIIAWYLNWIRGFTTRWMKLYVNVITEHKDRTTYWKVAFHRKYLMGKYNSSFKLPLQLQSKRCKREKIARNQDDHPIWLLWLFLAKIGTKSLIRLGQALSRLSKKGYACQGLSYLQSL